jgi:hypothetical protein
MAELRDAVRILNKSLLGEILGSYGIRPDMEAVSTSETSEIFYQTAWRNIPEDSHLQIAADLQYRSVLLSFCQTSTGTLYFIQNSATAEGISKVICLSYRAEPTN